MSSNRPYEEDASPISKLIGISLIGGASLGGYKYATDEDFRSNIKSKWSKMFTTKTTPFSYQGEKAEDIYSKLVDTNKDRKQRVDILKKNKVFESMDEYSKLSFADPVPYENRLVGMGSRNYSLGIKPIVGLGDVKSQNGISIGGEIKAELDRKMGQVSTTEIDGTFVKFKYSGGREVTLPMAVAHPDKTMSNVWISRNGHNIYAHRGQYEIGVQEGEQAISRTLYGHNERILQLLRSGEDDINTLYLEAGSYHGSGRDYLRKNTVREVKKAMDKEAQRAELSQVSMAEKLNKVFKHLHDTTTEWISAHDLPKASLVSQQYLPMTESALKAEAQRAGVGATEISIASSLVTGENIAANFMRGPLYEATVDPKTKAINPVQSTKNVAFNLSQSQTAKGGMTSAANLADISFADSMKSMKGLGFDKVKSARILNRINRAAPTAWIEGLEHQDIAYRALRESGVFNVLTFLTPFSADETMELSRNITNSLNVLTPKTITVNKLAIGGEATVKYKTLLGKTGEKNIGEILSDEKFLDSLEWMRLSQGTVVGDEFAGAFLQGSDDYELIKSGERRSVVLKRDMYVPRKAIDAMKEINTDVSRGFSLLGYYEEKALKVGGLGTTQRTSVTVQDTKGTGYQILNKINKAFRGRAGVESTISFDFYKKTLLKQDLKTGDVILGKSGGEYLSFLRNAIVGHVTYSRNNIMMTEGSEIQSIMSKYLLNPTKNITNLTEELTTKGLTFNVAVNESFDKQALDLQKVLASIRQSYWKGPNSTGLRILEPITEKAAFEALKGDFQQLDKIASGGFKYFESVLGQHNIKNVEELLRMKPSAVPQALRPLLFPLVNSLTPHETASTAVGLGDTVMRLGMKDMPLMLKANNLMGELNYYNMVDTATAMTQHELFQASMADKLTPEMLKKTEEALGGKIPLLNKELIDSQLGNMAGLSDRDLINAVENPEVFKNTLFNPEKNPYGFLIDVENATGGKSHKYIPGGTYMSGTYMIEDELRGTRGALLTHQKETIKALNSLFNNDGVMPLENWKQLAATMLEENVSSKGGILKRSALHVEGTQYLANVPDNFLKEMYEAEWKEAGTAWKELQYTLGNVGLVSEGDYIKNLSRKLIDANTIAKESDVGLEAYLRNLDKENGLADLVSKGYDKFGTKELSNDQLRSLARDAAEESKSTWNNIKSSLREAKKTGNTGEVTRILNEIKMFSSSELFRRDPNIYMSSITAGYGFVSDLLMNDQMALGPVLRTLMNADHDGDKIYRYMLNWSASKRNVSEIVQRDNAISFEVMKSLKNNFFKVSDTAKEFVPLGAEYAEAYNKYLGVLEKETGAASFLTKAITGSATVKAEAVKSYFEKAIAQTEGLSADLAERARIIGWDIPAFVTAQNIISSKHAEGILGNIEASRMSAILESVGNISQNTIDQSIKAMGELHPVMQIATVGAMGKGNKINYEAGFLDDVAAFFDLQAGWRGIDDVTQRERMYKRGWFSRFDTFEEFNQSYLKDAASRKWWSQDESIQAIGLGSKRLIDIYREGIESMPSSENFTKAMNQAFSKFKQGGADFIELLADVERNMNYSRSIGSATAIPEALRMADMARKTSSRFIPFEKMGELASKVRLKHVGIAAAAITVASAAINLLSDDDGTPAHASDLARHNSPSFERHGFQGIGEQRTMMSQPSYNGSMNLLTDSSIDRTSLMSQINSMVGLNGYNTSTVITDGNNPYSREMSRYN